MLAAASFFATATASSATVFLTQAELLALIPGHSISSTSKNGVKWVQNYAMGKKKGAISGKFGKDAVKSKWYVSGNQWCEDWGDGKACWDVERVDASSLRMYEDGVAKKNIWTLK